MTPSSIITQAISDNTRSSSNTKKVKQQKQLPDSLTLSLRGSRIEIHRETLLTLPESILIVMFPQGVMLEKEDGGEGSFCNVDFSIECLDYILAFYQIAYKNSEIHLYSNEFAQEAYLAHAVASGIPLNPLLTKQAIIVLREELEFFLVIVTSKSSSSPNDKQQQANTMMTTNLKHKSTELLVKEDLIFEALLKSIIDKDQEQEKAAEYHLIDMLCTAGFSRQDHWSYRASEPNKTCITSLSLVNLCEKNRLHIGQKLMIFWRKPARKCWWTNSIVDIDEETVKLWCRRTWTLELVLL